jgi:hypothetical protein
MSAWWSNLLELQQIMFIIAVTATLIMLLFLILMMFGMDDSTYDGGFQDSDLNFLSDEPLSAISGLKIFTIRGALAFFSIGGWTVYIAAPSMHAVFAIILGMFAGAIASFAQAYAFKAAMKLESVGNVDYTRAIGKSATVYIRVPGKRIGKGKVLLHLADRLVEVEAVTDDIEDIIAKKTVQIINLENDTTLVVSINKKGE